MGIGVERQERQPLAPTFSYPYPPPLPYTPAPIEQPPDESGPRSAIQDADNNVICDCLITLSGFCGLLRDLDEPRGVNPALLLPSTSMVFNEGMSV